MGRKKRVRSEDYDDSVEKSFFTKKYGNEEEVDEQPSQQKQQQSKKEEGPSVEAIERQRAKKKAKKLRQKEKKLAAKKMEEEAKAAEKKYKEEKMKCIEERKKEKELHKKQPPIHEFITATKGVQYCDIRLGKGPIVQDRKNVRVKYILRANDKKGKIIDSGGNFAFQTGKGEVIKGWEIGVKGMKQGGLRHIIVPPKAGYGPTKDIGGGRGAILYFEVTLLKC